ncbi:uncharacterized protein LOC144918807 [Branchiostoma floridae x Branchiostoma belcheri]
MVQVSSILLLLSALLGLSAAGGEDALCSCTQGDQPILPTSGGNQVYTIVIPNNNNGGESPTCVTADIAPSTAEKIQTRIVLLENKILKETLLNKEQDAALARLERERTLQVNTTKPDKLSGKEANVKDQPVEAKFSGSIQTEFKAYLEDDRASFLSGTAPAYVMDVPKPSHHHRKDTTLSHKDATLRGIMEQLEAQEKRLSETQETDKDQEEKFAEIFRRNNNLSVEMARSKLASAKVTATLEKLQQSNKNLSQQLGAAQEENRQQRVKLQETWEVLVDYKSSFNQLVGQFQQLAKVNTHLETTVKNLSQTLQHLQQTYNHQQTKLASMEQAVQNCTRGCRGAVMHSSQQGAAVYRTSQAAALLSSSQGSSVHSQGVPLHTSSQGVPLSQPSVRPYETTGAGYPYHMLEKGIQLKQAPQLLSAEKAWEIHNQKSNTNTQDTQGYGGATQHQEPSYYYSGGSYGGSDTGSNTYGSSYGNTYQSTGTGSSYGNTGTGGSYGNTGSSYGNTGGSYGNTGGSYGNTGGSYGNTGNTYGNTGNTYGSMGGNTYGSGGTANTYSGSYSAGNTLGNTGSTYGSGSTGSAYGSNGVGSTYVGSSSSTSNAYGSSYQSGGSVYRSGDSSGSVYRSGSSANTYRSSSDGGRNTAAFTQSETSWLYPGNDGNTQDQLSTYPRSQDPTYDPEQPEKQPTYDPDGYQADAPAPAKLLASEPAKPVVRQPLTFVKANDAATPMKDYEQEYLAQYKDAQYTEPNAAYGDSAFEPISDLLKVTNLPRDCADWFVTGHLKSDIYMVEPTDWQSFPVSCDMDTAGGGWTVLQRRTDGSVNFNRDWSDYSRGFGTISGEHWLGLDNLYYLTRQRNYKLRIDLTDWTGKRVFAEYDQFYIDGEDDRYRLHISGYHGNANDSMVYHDKQRFSTRDRDNDRSGGHCAEQCSSGWWFNNCHFSNLNGVYHQGGPYNHTFRSGIEWYHWKGKSYSLKGVEMKVRPSDF